MAELKPWRGAWVGVFALLASACSQPASDTQSTSVAAQDTQIQVAPAAESGPPLSDGFYEVPGGCPGEGCELGAWIATSDDELRARPDQTAPVVAHVINGEPVEAISSVMRLKPVRGVVVRADADQGLAQGDLVYLLEHQGEGYFSMWRRGEIMTWSWPPVEAATIDEATGIRWDRSEAQWRSTDFDPREGWWVQIRGAQGQTGWTRDTGYECRPVEAQPAHCQLM